MGRNVGSVDKTIRYVAGIVLLFCFRWH